MLLVRAVHGACAICWSELLKNYTYVRALYLREMKAPGSIPGGAFVSRIFLVCFKKNLISSPKPPNRGPKGALA